MNIQTDIDASNIEKKIMKLESTVRMLEIRLSSSMSNVSQLQQIVSSYQFDIDGNASAIDNTRAGDGIEIFRNTDRSMLIRMVYRDSEWTLQHSKPANNQCKITAGTICYGDDDISIAEKTVTLTGATEFVFVQVTRSSKVGVINHTAVRPKSDSTYFYLVLVSFTATSGSYDAGIVHRKGDYSATSPI